MRLVSRFLERSMKLPPAHTREVTITRDLRVPMRDGVVLLADHYVPRDGEPASAASLPTVLVRSPYGKGGIHSLLYGRPFAERGYQVLIQSCRGTEGSGGTFDPFRQEAADGLDTAAWIGRQPWFSGDLVTMGPSYLGFVQWALVSALASAPASAPTSAPENPGRAAAAWPKAMAVQVAPSDFREPVYEGESFALHTLLRWTRQRWAFEGGGRLGPLPAILGQVFGVEKREIRRAVARLPLGNLDRRVTGGRVGYWQDWLEHAALDDPWWDKARHRGAVAGDARSTANGTGISTPVHLLGGWYDLFLPGLLRDYATLRDTGKQPRLVVGPWAHEDRGWIGSATRESLAFFDAHVKGDARGDARGSARDERGEPWEAPVRIYVTRAGEWRDYPDYPPPGVVPERWHLHGGGRLAPEPPAPSEPGRYRYDPADPTPSVGGPLYGRGAGPVDNRRLEARPDVLLYTSEPLEEDFEVIGPVEAELWVRSTLYHADFFARLCDVEPSGRSVNICDALLRVSPDHPEPEPNGTLRLRVELWPTAHRFEKGRRLRLQISSGAHPRLARNTGSGEPLRTATKLVVANQEVFHDPGHPSAVILSVAPAPRAS